MARMGFPPNPRSMLLNPRFGAAALAAMVLGAAVTADAQNNVPDGFVEVASVAPGVAV
jgi:hypothetical protein